MRIVNVADYAAPYAGGFIPMVRAAASAATERGWTLELAVPAEAGDRAWLRDLSDGGVTAWTIPTRDRRRAAGHLRSAIDPGQPTILHSHFAGYDLPALAAAAGRSRAAAIWHIHSRLRDDRLVRWRNTVTFSVLARGVARSLCVAPDTVDDLLSRGAPRDRTSFFPNGVDTGRFCPPSPQERARARAELGLAADRPVLVHYGWDWRVKGGDMFVALLARLHRRGRDVAGLSVGGGEAGLDAARRAGIADAFDVAEPHDDVRRWHAAADVFISSSSAEGMPFAVIEALSAGVPAVASHVTQGHVAIGEGLGGYRLVAHDADAFADAVEALLDRSAERAQDDAEAAREAMRRRFDLPAWAARLMDVYADVGAPLRR